MIINYLFGFLSVGSGAVLPVLAAGALAFNGGQVGMCEDGGSSVICGEVNLCMVEGRIGMRGVNEENQRGKMEGRVRSVERSEMERRVEVAVRRQMERYPESRLIDYYKNFFQDKFGPGHMVSDTASAGAYLRRELAKIEAESAIVEESGVADYLPGNKAG